MSLNGQHQTLTVDIRSDTQRPHLKHEDFNVNSIQQLSQVMLSPLNLSQITRIELSPKEMPAFLLSTYRLKF